MKTIKSINSSRIKYIKVKLERVNEFLNNYHVKELERETATNVSIYDTAGEQMKDDYKMMIKELKIILKEVDLLGSYCGALDKKDYHQIVKISFDE